MRVCIYIHIYTHWLMASAGRTILKHCLHFSICACHPCAGAISILSVSFQCLTDDPRRESGPGVQYL